MAILIGDALAVLRTLPDGYAQCCVTSPPYYGLRDYGMDGQIGLEATPDAYVARLVEVFAEVRRVLADDGVLWCNLGDSYAMSTRGAGGQGKQHSNAGSVLADRSWQIPTGHKPKDLLGIPWLVAFALRADGWYLRSDCIWSKPNPMPESVTDRPTRAHEYVFLLSKSARYFYDAAAIAEPMVKGGGSATDKLSGTYSTGSGRNDGGSHRSGGFPSLRELRNRRTVWTIPTQPTPEAHFATMPEALVEPCILAGSRDGDRVIDPFIGSGTVGRVAERLGRLWTGIDLNPAYAAIAERRTAQRGFGALLAEATA